MMSAFLAVPNETRAHLSIAESHPGSNKVWRQVFGVQGSAGRESGHLRALSLALRLTVARPASSLLLALRVEVVGPLLVSLRVSPLAGDSDYRGRVGTGCCWRNPSTIIHVF
jgi:hypothetical protein